jgi:hypothetical protein
MMRLSYTLSLPSPLLFHFGEQVGLSTLSSIAASAGVAFVSPEIFQDF